MTKTAITTATATPKNKPYLRVNEDNKTAIVFTDEVRSSDIASYTEEVLRLTALGYKLQSVSDRVAFMNPGVAISNWLSGKFDINVYGIDISEDDLSIPQRLAEIQLALEAQMKPKPNEYTFAEHPIFFTTHKDYYAKRSLKDTWGSGGLLLFHRLRLGYNSAGIATRVVHSEDYTVSVEAAKEIWDEVYKIWAIVPPPTGSSDELGTRIRPLDIKLRHGGNRNVVVYNNGLAIGCQSVSRAALERVALELGWFV